MSTTENLITTAPPELAASGTWVIDPGHAEVSFIGRHFGLTKVRGRFTGVSGEARIAESGSVDRDEHLRSEDLFDVANHPTATFRSTRIDSVGTSGTVTGDLTIAGVTKQVVLDVEFLGQARDPWDKQRPCRVQRVDAHQPRGLGADLEHGARSRGTPSLQGDRPRDRRRVDPDLIDVATGHRAGRRHIGASGRWPAAPLGDRGSSPPPASLTARPPRHQQRS